MKLGKLLAAGKSIMSGRTDVSYRSSKQIYLPKFGSPKNPFKNEPPAQTESNVSAGGSATANSDENGSAVERRVLPAARPASPVRMAETAVRGSVGPSESPVEKAPFSRGESGRSAVAPGLSAPIQQKKEKDWGKFNPLSMLRAALPAHKAGRLENMAKGQKGTATQTELSLDSVKVVHNDLSDVDVEVVPIKSRASAPDLPAPKKSWEFVGERLFGVEAT